MKDTKEPRNLWDVCEEESFHVVLLDNRYCSLSYSERINCKHMGGVADHNNLYPCLNPTYMGEEERISFNDIWEKCSSVC